MLIKFYWHWFFWMALDMKQIDEIYRQMMVEALHRLHEAEKYLRLSDNGKEKSLADNAILQMRKAMEAIAFAAIAPQKELYEKKNPNFQRHYNATKIMSSLEKFNPHFYPLPLEPAVIKSDGEHFFDRKKGMFLTRKKFDSFYVRLGKYLHTLNPWGKDPQLLQLLNELPVVINLTYELLSIHLAVVKTEPISHFWIVWAKRDGSVELVKAEAGEACMIE